MSKQSIRNIFVGNSDKQQKVEHHKRKHFSRKKRLVVIAIVVIVLIGGGISGWLFISGKKSTSTQVAKTTDQVNSEAQALVDNGDTSAAKTEYADAIKVTSDPDDKYFLLQNLATVYFNDGDYDHAMTTILEAESTDLSSVSDSTKAFIASIYEAKGDKQQAIKYYQVAISLVDPSYPWASTRISSYQDKIDNLNNGVSN